MRATHRSRLEVLIREAPLVPVVLIVDQILLHDLVILVEEQVADGAGGCVLQIIHCTQREEARQGERHTLQLRDATRPPTPMQARSLAFLQEKISESGQGTV